MSLIHRCIIAAFTGQQKIDNVGEDSSQKQLSSVCFLFAGELENAVMKLPLISFISRDIKKLPEPTKSNCLGVLGKSWNCQILVINVVIFSHVYTFPSRPTYNSAFFFFFF